MEPQQCHAPFLAVDIPAPQLTAGKAEQRGLNTMWSHTLLLPTSLLLPQQPPFPQAVPSPSSAGCHNSSCCFGQAVPTAKCNFSLLPSFYPEISFKMH